MPNFKLSFLLYLICFCGFIYHSHDLYSGYMSGKTVVNIKIETILNQTLPVITVCYNQSINRNIFDLNDPVLKEINNYYLEKDDIKHNISKGFEKLSQEERNKLFLDRDKIDSILINLLSEMTVADFFDKVTIKWKYNDIWYFKLDGFLDYLDQTCAKFHKLFHEFQHYFLAN